MPGKRTIPGSSRLPSPQYLEFKLRVDEEATRRKESDQLRIRNIRTLLHITEEEYNDDEAFLRAVQAIDDLQGRVGVLESILREQKLM